MPSVGTGALGPFDCWLEVDVVSVIVVVVVSVVEELVVTGLEVVTVLVEEEVHVAGPSSLLEQPAPAITGSAALEVLSPIASEATRNTNTNPTRTRVAFLVLSFADVEEEDRVSMRLQYGSQIYIMALCDFKISKTPNSVDTFYFRSPNFLRAWPPPIRFPNDIDNREV